MHVAQNDTEMDSATTGTIITSSMAACYQRSDQHLKTTSCCWRCHLTLSTTPLNGPFIQWRVSIVSLFIIWYHVWYWVTLPYSLYSRYNQWQGYIKCMSSMRVRYLKH